MVAATQKLPDSLGRFGDYGGRYVPEILVAPLDQLESTYREAKDDPVFQAETTGATRAVRRPSHAGFITPSG